MVLLLVCSQILKIFSEIENHLFQITKKPLGKNWAGGKERGILPLSCAIKHQQLHSSNTKVGIV